jgi:hypothetical protein
MKKDHDKLIASLIKDCIDEMIRSGVYSDRKEGLDNIDPVLSICGFLKIAAVVKCKCGEVKLIVASPGDLTPEKEATIREQLERDGEMTFDDLLVGDPTLDGEIGIASNVGHISETCEKCGRRILGTWQMEAATLKSSTDFPWEDQESPDSSASGPMSPKRPMGSTVH